MALTVLKYRKGNTVSAPGGGTGILIKGSKIQQNITKKPIIKLEGGGGIVINKIQTGTKPMKRANTTVGEPAFKAAKIGNKHYSLQTITSSGTPLTSFDGKLYSIQQNFSGNSGTTINANKKQIIRDSNNGAIASSHQMNAIFSNVTATSTPIRITSNAVAPGGGGNVSGNISGVGDKKFAFPIIQSNGTPIQSTTGGTPLQIRRPTIYIKREAPAKTIRSITIELIEKNPYIHLGVTTDRLSLLKQVVCTTASVPIIHLYMTLKKLRQNEEFALLSEYFELNENDIQKIFTRTIIKLSKYLKFLIRWPESKKYYDRHKNLPIAFRSKLSYVQSLIECVETDIQQPIYQNNMEPIDCSNYKFILTITPTGVISYVSDAYVGHNDDLAIFNACDFQSVIPKYLSLVADPGKAIRRKRKPNKRQFNTSLTKITTITDINKSLSDGNDDSTIATTTASNEDVNIVEDQSNDEKSTIKTITTGTPITPTSTQTTTIVTTTPTCIPQTKLAVGATENRIENDSNTDSAEESESDENDTINDGQIFSKIAAPRTIELASNNLDVINSELTSRKVKDFSIPTVRVRESVCRLQIRHIIYCLREFKVLQPYAILEPVMYQYINEILIIAAALTNLQR